MLETKTEIKRRLTIEFLTKLSMPTDDDTVTKCLFYWWKHPKSTSSLELTPKGYTMMGTIKVKQYDVDVVSHITLTHNDIKKLGEVVQGPYFIHTIGGKKISMFDEQDAMMLTLYGGDLNQWIGK